ncbi:MAG: hypothetical protein AB7H88_08715 [Vicinamibacterales bacterium]
MRRLVAGFAAAASVLLAAGPVLAQAPARPISGFIVDLHGVTSGLPATPGWLPPVPDETALPTRGLGLDGGAHVFVASLGRVKVGVGARALFVRGATAINPEADTAAAATIPDVTTKLKAVEPEVSFNFGHRDGWSYISGGMGRAKVESEALVASGSGAPTIGGPAGWVSIFNYGGGARWLINDHVGFSFDVRWHQLSAVGTTDDFPGAMRTKMLVAGVGISIR